MSEHRRALHRFSSVREGLEAELGLLDEVAGGRRASGTLLWTTSPSLVVPLRTGALPAFRDAASRSASRGWPVETRRSGGGTTPQGPGILNVALAFGAPAGTSSASAYGVLCAALVEAIGTLGSRATVGPCPGAFCNGDFNVLVGGRKIAGTAQRWRRAIGGAGHAILAHALVLVEADLGGTLHALAAFERDLGSGFAPVPAAHVTLADALPRDSGITTAGFVRRLALPGDPDFRRRDALERRIAVGAPSSRAPGPRGADGP